MQPQSMKEREVSPSPVRQLMRDVSAHMLRDASTTSIGPAGSKRGPLQLYLDPQPKLGAMDGSQGGCSQQVALKGVTVVWNPQKMRA